MNTLLLTDDCAALEEQLLRRDEKVFLITANKKLLAFATAVYHFFYVDACDDACIAEIIRRMQAQYHIHTIVKF